MASNRMRFKFLPWLSYTLPSRYIYTFCHFPRPEWQVLYYDDPCKFPRWRMRCFSSSDVNIIMGNSQAFRYNESIHQQQFVIRIIRCPIANFISQSYNDYIAIKSLDNSRLLHLSFGSLLTVVVYDSLTEISIYNAYRT